MGKARDARVFSLFWWCRKLQRTELAPSGKFIVSRSWAEADDLSDICIRQIDCDNKVSVLTTHRLEDGAWQPVDRIMLDNIDVWRRSIQFGEGQILVENYVDNNSSYVVYLVDDNGIFQDAMQVSGTDTTIAAPTLIVPDADNSDELVGDDGNLQITTQENGSDTISVDPSGIELGADNSDELVEDDGNLQITTQENGSDTTSVDPSGIEPGADNGDDRMEDDDSLQMTMQDNGSDTTSAETSGTEPGADNSDDITGQTNTSNSLTNSESGGGTFSELLLVLLLGISTMRYRQKVRT